MIFYKNTLITSDWHILHRNIYWQLPEERSRLTGGKFFRPSGEEEFYAAEALLYANLLEEVKRFVQTSKVRRFLHLGDFCFLKNKREDLSLLDEIAAHIPAIPELFRLLKKNGIPAIMLLGNHDDPEKSQGKKVLSYFDEVLPFLWEEEDLYTHYPFGYSLAKDKAFGTPEQRFFGMPKSFSRLDKRLLEQWKGERVTNFHGHIHHLTFSYPLKEVKYVNTCIDFVDQTASMNKG